jgi:hypothetical protein
MMRFKLLSVLSIPCVLLVLACGRAAADEPKKDTAKEPAVVPFELLKSGHMAVQVKINGKGPFRLVFDTGAPLMLVTTRLAKEAGVVKKDAKAPGLGLFNIMGEPMPIKQFEMGALKADDVTTMVMDHPTVAQMEKFFGRIDGIVGFPFFARYRMTIDYQAKEMTFVPVDFKPTNIFDALMGIMMGDAKQRNAPKILAPAGQWGLIADKGTQDEDAGIDVKQVLTGGAAEKAGLKTGDRIITLDGRWTDSVIDLYEAVSHVKAGTTVPLKIKRDGKEMTLTVTPTVGL